MNRNPATSTKLASIQGQALPQVQPPVHPLNLRVVKRVACLLLFGALAVTMGGGCHVALAPVAFVASPVQGLCDSLCYNETVDDFALGWRNKLRAKKAWHAQKHKFAGHPHFKDFEKGFKDGYVEAASGGPGCMPLMPPRSYWSWRHHSQCGQEQMNTWFEGFPYGVAAAEQDGVIYYSQIQISDAISRQMEQHHPHAYLYNAPYDSGDSILESPIPGEIIPQGDPGPSMVPPAAPRSLSTPSTDLPRPPVPTDIPIESSGFNTSYQGPRGADLSINHSGFKEQLPHHLPPVTAWEK